jgi:predicted dehydrogenase
MTRRTFQALALGGAASRLAAANDSAAPPRIRIGQIGTRHAHAGGQFAALRNCADFEIVGVVEPDEEQRRRAAASGDFSGVNWISEAELLNANGLQAVAVETEVGSLLEHAERVVSAGLHLHLDKPAGESFPKFQRILETAQRKQRLVKMGYMFRFNPAFQLCQEAVKGGWLGKGVSVHAEMSKAIGSAERAKLAAYKGGSMFELGCHIIDAVVGLLGKPERVTPFPRSFPGDGFNDNMLAVLEYPDAHVTVRSSLMEPDGGTRRQFIVCGDHGSVEIRPLEPPAMKLMLDQARGKYRKGAQEVPMEKAPRYAADWTAFAKAIRGEWEWPWKPAHDLAVQETVLRASGMPLG